MPTNKPGSIAQDMERRRLKQDNFLLRQKYDSALKQLEQVQYELDTALKVKRHKDLVKPIRPREIKSGAREATWVALASDWHIEETVDPAKVNGVNSYNLTIARH